MVDNTISFTNIGLKTKCCQNQTYMTKYQRKHIIYGSICGAIITISTLIICDLIRRQLDDLSCDSKLNERYSYANSRIQKKPFSSGYKLLPESDHLLIVGETNTDVLLHSFKTQSSEESVSNKAEALQAITAAMHLFKSRGYNNAKAFKLLRHAQALSPRHPSVLNFLGERLANVEREDDMVEADHLFVRALTFSSLGSEEHVRALRNRQQTASVVEKIDQRTLTIIDRKKRAFQQISNSNPASLRRAKKEAYFQHVHNSVGIEGNTMSLAQTRSILETKMAVAGKSIMEHNEILGLDAALRYINQTLVDLNDEISLQDILEIHLRVIGHVDPVEAGVFRRNQVFVGDHIPPIPAAIDHLMSGFLNWLNGPDIQGLHPVRAAALAHYKLVYIHPFVDGNGRTSRLLMNLILMRHGFPPVIIRKSDRMDYYRHLQTANEGDIRPFVRFIAEATERTLDAYIDATSLRRNYGDNVPIFNTEDALQVAVAENHLSQHDAIIMGGQIFYPNNSLN